MTPFIVSISVLILVVMALFMNTIAEWIDFQVYKWEAAREQERRKRG